MIGAAWRVRVAWTGGRAGTIREAAAAVRAEELTRRDAERLLAELDPTLVEDLALAVERRARSGRRRR